jgi:hypothetical protein
MALNWIMKRFGAKPEAEAVGRKISGVERDLAARRSEIDALALTVSEEAAEGNFQPRQQISALKIECDSLEESLADLRIAHAAAIGRERETELERRRAQFDEIASRMISRGERIEQSTVQLRELVDEEIEDDAALQKVNPDPTPEFDAPGRVTSGLLSIVKNGLHGETARERSTTLAVFSSVTAVVKEHTAVLTKYRRLQNYDRLIASVDRLREEAGE